MNQLDSLSDAELDELDDFLMSDKTPKECMDVSTLDGFLTALVIGPETILPSRWLPVLWGEAENDEIIWESKDKMKRIVDLIMCHYNSIVKGFQVDPPDFNPIIFSRDVEGKEVTIIDEWCSDILRSLKEAASYEELTRLQLP